ncbi:MAG: GFA family protein [Myxococcota bacterium]
MSRETYSGSCHCGAVRFRFTSEAITTGYRCNCSICVRKGAVLSSYVPATAFELVAGEASLSVYRFGDRDLQHCFCETCGVAPFTVVASVPDGYAGLAQPGARRVNLGCVDGLDPFALTIVVLDGRSL